MAMWKYLHYIIIFNAIHHNGVVCKDSGKIDGAIGGSVILHVNTDMVNDISWTFGGNHIATTEAGKVIQPRGDRYKGKLDATADGSLVINNLTQDDHGTYIASVSSNTPQGNVFTLHYQLQVYKNLSENDIQVEPTVTNNETCSVTVSCTANGSDVTIIWSSSNGTIRNTTGHVLIVHDPNPHTVYTCTAQNPVSTSTKSVTPWDYCDGKSNNGTIGILIFVIFVIILCPIIVIIVRKWKKRGGSDLAQAREVPQTREEEAVIKGRDESVAEEMETLNQETH